MRRNPFFIETQYFVALKFIQSQKTDVHIKAMKEILNVKHYDDYLFKNDIPYKFDNDSDLLVVVNEIQMNIIKCAHKKVIYN